MMNSTEKSLPEKLSDDIIAYILEEAAPAQRQNFPTNPFSLKKWEPDEAPSGKP